MTEKVMQFLTEKQIGFVGTARNRLGWPPEEFRLVDDDRFNTLYNMPGPDGDYLMCRWVDNNVVTVVTNVHKGTKVMESHRKKPRATKTNKKHLEEVWGEEYVRTVKIPKLIDNYNNTMNGVNKADQLISYYRPKVRCRRIWIPLMFHCLNVLRINLYIVCKSLQSGRGKLDQKTTSKKQLRCCWPEPWQKKLQ